MPRRLSDTASGEHKTSSRNKQKQTAGEMAGLLTAPDCKGPPPPNSHSGPTFGPLDIPPAVATDQMPRSDGPTAAAIRPHQHEAQHILEMARELKKLAAKSGLARVALILEMAELEARDQVLGRA